MVRVSTEALQLRKKKTTSKGRVDRAGPRLLESSSRLCGGASGGLCCPGLPVAGHAHTSPPARPPTRLHSEFFRPNASLEIISTILGVSLIPLCHFFSVPPVEGATSGGKGSGKLQSRLQLLSCVYLSSSRTVSLSVPSTMNTASISSLNILQE